MKALIVRSRAALGGAARRLGGRRNPLPDSADPLEDLVEVLGPLGVRGVVRSAVELFGTYGDSQDVLSTVQVDRLCVAAEHFAACEGW